jgi:hypothetical protein
LIATKKEIIKMKVDGEDHFNFTTDLMENYKMQNFKTSAAFLITKLCENFAGLGSNLVNFSLQILDLLISEGNIENYPNLNASKLISTIPQEFLIDINILVINLLIPHIIRNPKNLENLKTLFTNYSSKLYSTSSVIIQDRLCLFLGNYLDELYKITDDDAHEHVSNAVKFLFIQLLQFKNNPGLSYQAAHALSQLIYNKTYNSVFSDILNQIMPKLIENIREIEVTLFFNVLTDIAIYMDIENHLNSLCKEVVQRILFEIKSSSNKTQSGKDKYNIYINKCFNLLTTILERNNVFNQISGSTGVENALILEDFEKIIEPIVHYLKNPQKIEFEAEIITLLTTIILDIKKVNDLSKAVYPYLKRYVEKHTGLTPELFEFMNLMIIYDDGFLFNEDNMETFVNMLLISYEDDEAEEMAENSSYYSSCLMQVLLQVK